jgi:hypothetical protein
MADQEIELEKIRSRLQSIENRVCGLEAAVTTGRSKSHVSSEEFLQNDSLTDVIDEGSGIESRIGRFGLAWIGNIVLLFGITFLTQYLFILGYQISSIFFGYLSSLVIFIISGYLKKSYGHLAFMFRMNAQLLLFYITLRLHFYSVDPILESKAISISLLLLLVFLQVYLSILNKSQTFGFLSVVFALITAILSDSTHLTLIIITGSAACAVYFFYRFNWQPVLLITVILTYSSFFLWLFGNPLLGHPMKMIEGMSHGIVYLFALGACFSAGLLFRNSDGSSDDFLIGLTIVNGILFTLLLFLVVVKFFNADYVTLFVMITICCILFSVYLHKKLRWNYGSAFYALYGFMAMSIAVYGLVGFPQVYLLLSIQSLIVVSMALWFRNRLIVVMNSLLFMAIILIYMISSKSISEVNFSFALVALISARIINWKKSRLQLKTDILRNLYMIEGFFMMLYALFIAIPDHFIALSWTIAALLYFLFSILLKNVKYRYMALATVICAAFYLFIVDLAKIEMVYRVLALLFLAVISIGISVYYTSRVKKSGN